MIPLFEPSAPKKATNVTVNQDLLRRAREEGINLSRALEEKLAEILAERYQERWREENREAIEAYNRRVSARGVFSDGWRRF
ncbi:type II toxin-antitoxin system CcdA family antitoxin [Deferrisoma palaeochoriense]